MSEENKELVPELDTDIVYTVFVDSDGNEIPELTPYYEHVVMVAQKVRTPLYVGGVRISDEALAELGLTVKEVTRAEMDAKEVADLYARDAAGDGALRLRVTQYKEKLDLLGLEYTVSQDAIVTAIQNAEGMSDTEKNSLAIGMKATYDAITTNLEQLGSDRPHMDTYLMVAKLIKYLPVE